MFGNPQYFEMHFKVLHFDILFLLITNLNKLHGFFPHWAHSKIIFGQIIDGGQRTGKKKVFVIGK